MTTRLRVLASCFLFLLFFGLTSATCCAQAPRPKAKNPTPGAPAKPKAAPKPEASASNPFLQLFQDPQLLERFGTLFEKLEADVHFPAPRGSSRLLPLMPGSTVFYAAIPNYADTAQEALGVFHRELQQDQVLRRWWRSGDMAKIGPGIEEALQKFHDVAQYLGDEIVVSSAMEKPNPSVVVIAQIAKPGLKAALQQIVRESLAGSKTKLGIRIVDSQELDQAPAAAKSEFLVLVRPDYMVGAADIATLRRMNARLDSPDGQFVSAPFGRRVAQAYQDGVTVLAAADLHSIVNEAMAGRKEDISAAQRTGFTDVQYLVWEHTKSGTRDISQTELSFTGRRRGMAAWLGAPKPLGGLDFASPKAIMAISLNLADPSKMFDDLRELATTSNPNALAGVSQLEQSLNISVQHDLLQALNGDITIDVDSVAPPAPVFKLMFGVKDPARVQQTLAAIVAAQHLPARQVDDSGTTFNLVRVPMGQAPMEIAYTVVDGYLVIASTPEAAKEAVRLHRAGESLVKSPKFLSTMPPGHSNGMSAMFYQDPTAIAALRMQQMSGTSLPLAQMAQGGSEGAVISVYATDNAIRTESTSATMDTGVVLVVAAIAIPNLLRSRVAANEASAVGSLRTLNVAQVTYAATYPDHGFAQNLATLAGGGGDPDHAGLIDNTLGCSSGQWCEKAGYRFRISATCLQGQCAQYVAVATPISASTGGRNFCSTSDGVIRMSIGPPLTESIRAAQCKTWQPLQ